MDGRVGAERSSMEKAKIFMVEDDLDSLESWREILQRRGHEVVLCASNLADALQLINRGELQTKGVNLVILDRSFPPDKASMGEMVGGPIVAQSIEDAGIEAKIIAHSGMCFGNIEYGHIFVHKGDGVEKMLNAIASL